MDSGARAYPRLSAQIFPLVSCTGDLDPTVVRGAFLAEDSYIITLEKGKNWRDDNTRLLVSKQALFVLYNYRNSSRSAAQVANGVLLEAILPSLWATVLTA